MNDVRAFVDRRVADVGAAAAVADVAAAAWGLGRPVLLRHGMNAIFRSGDSVIRVASPTVDASCSIELAETLAAHGIPVVAPARPDVVVADGLSATAWEFVDSSGDPVDWRAVGSIVGRVHALSVADLPTTVPTPSPASFPWWHFDALLDDVGAALDPSARKGIQAVLDRWAGWSDWDRSDAVVCHGDVHPGNVIMTGHGPVLIDWDLLCVADPAWDHAMLTTYAARWGGDAAVYERFRLGYGDPAVDAELAASLGELRNVAATLMRVKAGRTDPAAAAEAEHRLRFWRGESDAAWRAQ